MRSMTVTSTFVRECRETGKQPVQIILDLGANPPGFVRLYHRRPRIAGAKERPSGNCRPPSLTGRPQMAHRGNLTQSEQMSFFSSVTLSVTM